MVIRTLSAVGWYLTKGHSNKGESYSYDEVCNNLYWFRRYIDTPNLLLLFHPLVYFQWLDYRSRVKNPNYNYWLVCYAFGI